MDRNRFRQSVRMLCRRRPWLPVLAPQVIHLGFLLMMFGHLLSSLGAVHNTHSMAEGSAVKLPGGDIMRLAKVELTISPKGYPTDWSDPGGGRNQPGPLRCGKILTNFPCW